MRRRPDPLAVNAARTLIASLQIRAPAEIDIELIAAHLDVLVQRRPMSTEEGRLIRAGNRGIIVVNEEAFSSKKWRFVVAHELGHFIRHPDVDQFALCTDVALSAWYEGSGREGEANDFAAELLLPEDLVAKHCDRNRPSLREVREVATEFNTSVTAAAIRFVQFAPEPCAVVQSTDGAIDWVAWSQTFRPAIRRGTRLTTTSYAGDIFAGRRVDDRPQQVDAAAWSDSARVRDLDLFEHSIPTSGHSVLTFLWHPDT